MTRNFGVHYYSMNKSCFILFFIACLLARLNAWSATSFDDIAKNLGGIDFNGLPRLSFNLADRSDIGELADLGFAFALTHRARLHHGRTARTEWIIPCLQTCAYIDADGGVTWLTTRGQMVRFPKNEHGYAASNNGANVKVMPEHNMMEITTQTLTRWRYRNGFLESFDNLRGRYTVTTNHGAILFISKTTIDRDIPLLKCVYSKRGDLEELEFAGSKKYRLQWSVDHCLMAIDGPAGRRFDFEYANSLLTCWTEADGSRNELKWWHLDQVREAAFQRPPVRLREDARFTYDWKRNDNVDIVTIHDKTGAFVSETKIGSAGLEQRTPKGILEHKYTGAHEK
jgi:hypothetical protein